MFDIESTIADSLRSQADVGLGRTALHDGAVARARTLRRRRRVTRTLAGALGVAVATATVIVAPQLLTAPSGAGQPITVGAPPAVVVDRSRPTSLPELLDVAPAGQDPTLVGTDPGVLHFDVDLAAIAQTAVDFTSAEGYESLETIAATDLAPEYHVAIGPDRAKLPGARGTGEATTVNGRPATLTHVAGVNSGFRPEEPAGWYLEWQPVDGLYAVVRVVNGERAQVFAAAAALRLDRAQRCAVPLRLTGSPQWTLCRTGVRTVPVAGSVWVRSTIELREANGPLIQVYVEEQSVRATQDQARFSPDQTVNGHPVDWRPADPRGLWALNVGPMEVFITGATAADTSSLTREQAIAVFTGLSVAGDLGQPSSWPARVFAQG